MKVLIIGKRSFIAKNIEEFLLKKNITTKKISFKNFLSLNSKKLLNYQFIINCSINKNFIKKKYKKKNDNDRIVCDKIKNINNRIIIISSRKVYRNKFNLTEKSATNPLCNYSKNKLKSEKFCEKILSKRLIILRTSNLIGKRNYKNTIHKTFIDNFFKNIKQGKIEYNKKDYKDFLSVDQFSKVVYKILNTKNMNGIYNLSIGKRVYINEIVQWLLKYNNKTVKINNKSNKKLENFTLNNKKLCNKIKYKLKKKDLIKYCYKLSKESFSK